MTSLSFQAVSASGKEIPNIFRFISLCAQHKSLAQFIKKCFKHYYRNHLILKNNKNSCLWLLSVTLHSCFLRGRTITYQDGGKPPEIQLLGCQAVDLTLGTVVHLIFP
jgi:hypothetical protein